MPYLVYRPVSGSTTDLWELGDKPLTFGRGEQSDNRVADDRMSRQHFAIIRKDTGYFVQDLKSTNGTWVNNERITEALLKPNDKIRAGQTVFVFLTDKPKGLATIMGELEVEGKGLHTYLGEMAAQSNPTPPA